MVHGHASGRAAPSGTPVPSSGGASAEARGDAARLLGTVVVLAAFVWGVYGRALDAPFIFDDIPGIVNNPSITRLWPPLGDAETRGPLNPPGLVPTARRPLVNLTFAIDRHFHGLRPAGYRAVNLVVHLLSAVVLASLVRRTLRLPYFAGVRDRAAWPLSLAVALLWAVHPLNTEAVVYVTQRTELLVALFYLTTLWAALRHWTAASGVARRAWLAVATFACLAGIASKEVIVSAPLVVLLYERTFLAPSPSGDRRSWPLYAGLALGWALLLLLNAGGVSGLTDPRHHVPVHVWWMTQAKVLLLYLELAVWPWPLSIHYAPAYLRTVEAAWPWLAAVALLGAATVVLVWRRPAVRFVVAAVVLILAPTLVVPLPKMMAAERRMYLPLAGLVALAIVGAYRSVATRWPRASARPFAAAMATLVLAATLGSVARLGAYETAVTIWTDAVRHQPDDPMAHYNLGVALLEDGRPQEAMPRFAETLRLDPEHTGALDNLGMILNRLGRPQEALAHLERALRSEPDDPVAHNNLGAALLALGRPQEAIAHLDLALVLRPDEPKAKVHLNLGRAFLDTGRTAEAIAHLERAVELQPDDADAQYSLGVALSNVGRPGDAIRHFEEALRLEPADPEAHNALASALLRTGESQRAADHYRRALGLRSDYPEVHNNLGAALLDLGRPEEAVEHFERALELEPDHANAHYNLARALLDAGRPQAAVEHLREALRLGPNDARARFTCAIAYARSDEPSAAVSMAEAALALARSQGDTALADEIDAWLASSRAAPVR